MRASALERLSHHDPRPALKLLRELRNHDEALVRYGTARAAERLPPGSRRDVLGPLLADPVKLVRSEAARALAGIHGDLRGTQRQDFDQAFSDLVDRFMAMAERPEANLNRGAALVALDDIAGGQQAYRDALRQDPSFIAGYINLADSYRTTGDEAAAESQLRTALAIEPDHDSALYALGLCLIRQRRYSDAVSPLEQATAVSPGAPDPRRALTLLLIELGEVDRALNGLNAFCTTYPAAIDLRVDLVLLAMQQQRRDLAMSALQTLIGDAPDDARVQNLLQQLGMGMMRP
ncbi:MAG: HEAT repeat domain-containing protein [Planctomycetota bacterium]|jgi:tetratricopeptide (TPR) repeat protein